jgi:beta-glucosidase
MASSSAALAISLLVVGAWGRSPWPQAAYANASALLASLTTQEKLGLLYGRLGSYIGNVPGIPRLKLPPLNLEDGPQGVADGATKVTAWPSALTVTMSWDVDLAEAWGAAMGAEQAAKGTNVMLGPAVNLARVPWAGRNFEYMGVSMCDGRWLCRCCRDGKAVHAHSSLPAPSAFTSAGEDPVLAARMVAREVAGIQSNNISGCIKHWVNNNQEHDR